MFDLTTEQVALITLGLMVLFLIAEGYFTYITIQHLKTVALLHENDIREIKKQLRKSKNV